MDIWIIFPPLLIGLALGYFELWPGVLSRIEGPMSKFALLILLALMGTKIGSDGEILSSIGNIGLISLVIAVASIVGSVILLGLISPALRCISEEASKINDGSGKIHLKLTGAILVAILIGALLGYTFIGSGFTAPNDTAINYTLGLLLLAVGISLGLNKSVFKQASRFGWKIVLIPLSIATGSILGPLLASFLVQTSPVETAAVGAGFGWYSLSAILLTKLSGPELGAIAFLANTFRELLTFLILPVAVRYLGKIVSIAPGGATTMDVTLPLLRELGGKEIVLPAFFSGAVLSSLVPLLVPLIIGL
ncbi:MAG: lysine exporter LysO family protein [Candidatus Bipolaricaulota bacterium]